MESEEQTQSEKSPRRVSFSEDVGSSDKKAKADAEMKVFRMRVYYSEAFVEGALKTFPQTKVGTIVSKTSANHSNFLNSIRKKLVVVGVNPLTRLVLTAIPPVPADQDYSIAHWLRKYPGAAMVVSPEDEADALYRQVLTCTFNGQPVARNPLYEVNPEDHLLPATLCSSSSMLSSLSRNMADRSSPEVLHLSLTNQQLYEQIITSKPVIAKGNVTALGSGWTPPAYAITRSNTEDTEKFPTDGQGTPARTSIPIEAGADGSAEESAMGKVESPQELGSGPSSPASQSSGVGSPDSTSEDRTPNSREFTQLQERLFAATLQLIRLEKEDSSQNFVIQKLKEELEGCKTKLRDMESEKTLLIQKLEEKLEECNIEMEVLNRQCCSVEIKEVYRRMFLDSVRNKVRAKLKVLFPCPGPIDFLTAPYEKVLATCEEMEDLEMHLGVTYGDLELTKEDITIARSVHANETMHIGIYADIVESQDPLYVPSYQKLFKFLYNQNPQTVLDNLISCWT